MGSDESKQSKNSGKDETPTTGKINNAAPVGASKEHVSQVGERTLVSITNSEFSAGGHNSVSTRGGENSGQSGGGQLSAESPESLQSALVTVVVGEYLQLKQEISEVQVGSQDIIQKLQELETGASIRKQILQSRLHKQEPESTEPRASGTAEQLNLDHLKKAVDDLTRQIQTLSDSVLVDTAVAAPGDVDDTASSSVCIRSVSPELPQSETGDEHVVETEDRSSLDSGIAKQLEAESDISEGDEDGSRHGTLKCGTATDTGNQTGSDVAVVPEACQTEDTNSLGSARKGDHSESITMNGFTEKFELSEHHQEFAKCLRRRKTDVGQDNRLVDVFGLQANEGCVYQSSESVTAADGQISANPGESAVSGLSESAKNESVHYSRDSQDSRLERQVKTVSFSSPEVTGVQQLPTAAEDMDPEPGAVRLMAVMGSDGKMKMVNIDKDLSPEMAKFLVKEASNPENNCVRVVNGEVVSGGAELQKLQQLIGQEGGEGGALLSELMSLQSGVHQQISSILDSGASGEDVSERLELLLQQTQQAAAEAGIEVPSPGSLSDMIHHSHTERTPSPSPLFVEHKKGKATTSTPDDQPAPTISSLEQPARPQPDTRPTASARPQPDTRPTSSARPKPDTRSSSSARPQPDTRLTASARPQPDTRPTVSDRPDTEDMLLSDEPVLVSEAVWADAVNKEVQRGKVARDIREKGADTILCIDISDSMKGAAWEQASRFLQGFMESVQDSTILDAVFEHIAIVTFGHETKVQQHMTCDYIEVTRKIDRLRLGGPSPMFAGLSMCYAAMLGAGTVFVSHGYKISPRVILLTDGKTTPSEMVAGPDHCGDFDKIREHINILDVVKKMHKEYHWTIYPVPVGDCDITFLEKIAEETKGRLVSPEDWARTARYMKNILQASKLGALGGSPELLPLMTHGVSSEDQADMLEFLKTHKKRDGNDEESDDPNMPHVGTRVRRGVDWRWNSQDSHGVGTVTGYPENAGWISVEWDQKDIDGKDGYNYRYGADGGAYDIQVVDEPRVLRADELIATGCTVRRGKDWRYTDQDGGAGNLGVVYTVTASGSVKVRWSNGHKNNYRYGSEGKFDVEIVNPTDPDGTKAREAEVNEMNRRNAGFLATEGAGEATPGREGDHPSSQGATGVDRQHSHNRQRKNEEASRIIGYQTKDTPSTEDRMNEMNRRNQNNSSSHGNPGVPQATVSHDQEQLSEERLQNARNSGAIPKRPTGSPDSSLELSVVWQFKSSAGDWQTYPPDIVKKVETSFQNTRPTAMIQVQDKRYRIVFKRMEQTDIDSKETVKIQRLENPS